jgi:ABC-type thiamin/hydroxymethylpyrimidine transport system permease subunit
MSESRRYYLTTKDLVTIALLSALGGVLSTYLGYLGNLINHAFGVPFGAGQFLAGMHVLWIALAVGITRKKGVGTLTGTVKGIVELFMGSTHGIVIVLVSLVQGAIVDLFLFSDKTKAARNPISYGIAGAVASASNVVVFQVFFFSGVPLVLIAMLCMLAGGSGMIFCGWLASEMLSSLEHAGVIESKEGRKGDVLRAPSLTSRRSRAAVTSLVAVIMFLGIFTVGGVYYFFAVYHPPGATSVDVMGQVNEPFEFVYSDFKDREVTFNAELNGSVTHVSSRNYTGIPLRPILELAAPRAGADQIVIVGSDGYSAVFRLADALSDDRLIIAEGGTGLRIVAANYEGAYWVENVVKIEVR